jgi:hypothetical protein
MLLNLIPFFLANILGVRTAVIGLIEGIAETTASLLKIFFGTLSDRFGKRKPFQWLDMLFPHSKHFYILPAGGDGVLGVGWRIGSEVFACAA